MGCVLGSDWCGEEEVPVAPVVRSSSLKRRTLERSESARMRLTKVSLHAPDRNSVQMGHYFHGVMCCVMGICLVKLKAKSSAKGKYSFI